MSQKTTSSFSNRSIQASSRSVAITEVAPRGEGLTRMLSGPFLNPMCDKGIDFGQLMSPLIYGTNIVKTNSPVRDIELVQPQMIT